MPENKSLKLTKLGATLGHTLAVILAVCLIVGGLTVVGALADLCLSVWLDVTR